MSSPPPGGRPPPAAQARGRGVPPRVSTADRLAQVSYAVGPLLVTAFLVVVLQPLVPGSVTVVVLSVMGLAVAMSLPPWADRWIPKVLFGLRHATPAEQLVLAGPVSRAAGEPSLEVPGMRIRVTSGRGVLAFGSRTVLIGLGMIEDLRRQRLHPDHAAARIGRQMSLLSSGALRWEPTLGTLTMPVHVVRAVPVLFPVLTQGLRALWSLRWVYLTLGVVLWWVSGDLAALVCAAALAVSYILTGMRRSWPLRKERLADRGIASTSLGPAYAQWLLRTHPSWQNYERAYTMTAQPPTRTEPWW